MADTLRIDEGSIYHAVSAPALLEIERQLNAATNIFAAYEQWRRGPWWARALGRTVAWLAVGHAVYGARRG